jgi:hypothetical protein
LLVRYTENQGGGLAALHTPKGAPPTLTRLGAARNIVYRFYKILLVILVIADILIGSRSNPASTQQNPNFKR